MNDGWQATFTQQALSQVDAYIATHPEYTRQGVEQPGQGATNRVVFARRHDELVVFKVFCEAERKQRACFALKHWKETGLVPGLIADVSDDMVIITYIPGIYLFESQQQDPENVWNQAIYHTAKAIGKLASVPLSHAQQQYFDTRFYQPLGDLESYLMRILDLGLRIQAQDPDFSDSFWHNNLHFIEDQLPVILSQPRVLYHQDVSNLHVHQGRFMGFFDLEMCRAGCAAMQLGAAIPMFEGDRKAWRWFQTGWQIGTGENLTPGFLQTAAAARYLLGWREISRYMSYDGTPGTGYSWASPANPATYYKHFTTMDKILDFVSFQGDSGDV